MGDRRKNFELLAKKFGFGRSNPAKYGDEYKNEKSPHVIFYFDWNKGKGNDELNLTIHPQVPYEKLLELKGVSLKKTSQPKGIYFSTNMKEFPKDHEGLRPAHPTTRVGRKFESQESALSEFLKYLVVKSEFLSTSQNGSYSGNRDSRENNKDGKNSSEKAPSEPNKGLQLAVKGIEDEYKNKPGEDVDAIVKRRVGQSEFRDLLVEIYGAACHVSDLAKGRLLIASHIVPWSKSSGEEKTDPDNGLLLAVNWDAVFDKGFISFDAKGEVMFSDELDEETSTRLGLDRNARLKNGTLTPKRLEYLKRHREEIFKDGKKAN